jgi:glycosyltransferase involved in cell wall biosynthesis
MNVEHPPDKLLILSRCARTLYGFRRSLAQRAAECGYSVRLAGAGGDGFDDRLIKEGFQFRPVPISFRGLDPVRDLWLFAALVRLMLKERPRVVHCFTIKPVIYGTVAAWITRVPVRVVTITGLGHAFISGHAILRTLIEQLYRLSLHRAHTVFFQNPEDLALFVERRLVQREQARLVPGSGVDLHHFPQTPLPMLSSANPRFLMIARLLKEKGIGEFIEAARIVKRSRPGVSFQLVGGVDTRNPSQLTEAEFEALNYDNVVDWVGEVGDVRPFIAGADIVVLPSYREGVPRSLLEGAAMGRALLAADTPGCREIAKHDVTGLLVPPRDPSALADAMKRLLENSQLVAIFGQSARRLVESHFDETIVLSLMLRAYNIRHEPPIKGASDSRGD